jgi:RNA polymerase sigma-70 factor (ECF subfamily)
VSSSFPAARFPALPLSKEKEAAHPIYKDTKTAGHSEEPSDETLIERIRSNDDEALTLLFRRYARLVWSIAQRIVRDRGEAEDIMQEVFLTVHQKSSVFDASKGPARTLIIYMTYQLAYKRRRYLNGRHGHYSCRLDESRQNSEVVTASFYDESIEAHFGRERLREALAALSELQRETLRLYFFEGYVLDEIAAKLEQSIGNTRHHYFRGLDRLRRHLLAKGTGGS